MEFTLLAAAVTAVGMALLVGRLEKNAGLIPEGTGSLGDLILGGAVAGLITGRLAAMILAGTSPIFHPGDILIVRSGVDTGFASLGALGFVAWVARRQLPATLDALAPAALAGLAGWHAGCLYRGACLGTTSTLPWSIAQDGSNVTRHPVEIYAALLFVLAAVALFRWLSRTTGPGGRVGAAAVFLAGAVRLATEPLRPSLGPGPVGWYLAAMAIGAAGVWIAGLRSKPGISDSP